MTDDEMAPPARSYNALSVAVHWISATLIFGLFFTHESAPGSGGAFYHIALGSLIGVFLIWRVVRRVLRGHAEKPDQHWALALLTDLVRWGILLATVTVVITGWLMPWANGTAINMAGLFAIPSPLGTTPWLFEWSKRLHDVAGHAFVPLVLLHMAGVTKHALNNRDRVMERMLGPVRGGH